ncbi:MAG: hypothetical protein NUW37_18140 [Planctomycetes bacterium]|nr:hypothetical protein [Planctomycetota bacterium]
MVREEMVGADGNRNVVKTRRRWRSIAFACAMALVCAFLVSAGKNGANAEESRASEKPAAEKISIMWWNIENLFDFVDDPDNDGDDEYLPGAPSRWNEARYNRKLERLAELITKAEDKVPDVICMAEVENKRVVQDLANKIAEMTGGDSMKVYHEDMHDARGIDLAVISRLDGDYRVFDSTDYFVDPESEERRKTSRDHAVFKTKVGDQDLFIFLNHWKSRSGGREETAARRMACARGARAEIDRVRRANPNAGILATGDFNDDYTDASIAFGMQSSFSEGTVAGDLEVDYLFNMHGTLATYYDKGTLFYWPERGWNTFDQVMVLPRMVGISRSNDRSRLTLRVVDKSFHVVHYDAHAFHDPSNDPRGRAEKYLDPPLAFREIRGEWQDGFSDHFPVWIELESSR